MRPDNTEKYKNIILPIILKHLPHAKVMLYGSRARGDSKEGSDIDVAIDIGREIDFSILSKIMGDIDDSKLPILFDVVDFHGVSADLQKEIMKDKIIWQP